MSRSSLSRIDELNELVAWMREKGVWSVEVDGMSISLDNTGPMPIPVSEETYEWTMRDDMPEGDISPYDDPDLYPEGVIVKLPRKSDE